MLSRPARAAVATLLSAALAIAACGGDDNTATDTTPASGTTAVLPCKSETVKLAPADFVAGIDNPYFPIAKGTTWSYRGSDESGTKTTAEVTATGKTKKIAGITATALRDANGEDGQLVEVATEWYAQDKAGNVWYLGEDVKEFEGGKVSDESASLVGGGALQPGVAMSARPVADQCFRLAYEKGETDDRFVVKSVNASAKVPAGRYSKVVKLEQRSPIEPDAVEERYYARGVGLVLVVVTRGGSDRIELVDYKPGPK